MRIPVELRHAWRLLNHGPTTLVSAAHGARRNVMAAAWVMPLDLDPSRLAVVMSDDTFTRELVEASGELVVQLPTAAMIDLTIAVGSTSGHDVDKFQKFGIATSAGSMVGAPLVDGCAAWLECRITPEPWMQERYDLFSCEVVAAWADDRSWTPDGWVFTRDEDRTVHHMSKGVFYATGQRLQAKGR